MSSCSTKWGRPGTVDPSETSVKVRDRRSATDSLYPDILNTGGDRIQIGFRDDHHGCKGFVISVPLPVEVGLQHNRLVSGVRCFQGFGCGTGAPEHRGREQLGCVPAHSLPGKASVEWPRGDVRKATKSAPRANEVRQFVGASSGNLHRAASGESGNERSVKTERLISCGQR